PVLILVCGAVAVSSPYLLAVMGHSYSSHSTRLLQLVALGMVMRAVLAVRIALARVCREVTALLAIQGAMAVFLLGGSLALSRAGLTGIGIAYAGTQTVLGLLVLPGLISFLTGRRVPGTGEHRLAARVRASRDTILLAVAGAGAITLIVVGLTQVRIERI